MKDSMISDRTGDVSREKLYAPGQSPTEQMKETGYLNGWAAGHKAGLGDAAAWAGAFGAAMLALGWVLR
jgi:hypothetical protein